MRTHTHLLLPECMTLKTPVSCQCPVTRSVQKGIQAEGVYVSYFGFGSPASRSRLFAGRRIVSVNGQPTSDIDQFLASVNGLANRDSVRLNTVTWNNVPEVITLKLDKHYWPSYELRNSDQEWQRYLLE